MEAAEAKAVLALGSMLAGPRGEQAAWDSRSYSIGVSTCPMYPS